MMDLKKARRKLRSYHIALALGVILAVISIGCFAASVILTNNAYESLVGIAPATESETRKAAYIRAIGLNPGRTEAYLLLLDTYNEDGVFTKTESEELLGLYNSNRNRMNWRVPGYAQLHYEIGLLYINGYENTSSTRLRMAMSFLETAEEYMTEDDPGRLAVECYCQIGKYYQDYIWAAASSTREVSEMEMQSLIQEIRQTLTAFREDNSPDAVYNELGFCEAVCNLLYDQRDILAMTVPEEDVNAVMDSIYEGLPEKDELQKEQTKDRLEELKKNEETYRDMISRAYERGSKIAD